MSNLSTFAEVGLVDARASAGTLIVPNSCDIPGRVITFKDLYGATGNSTIALLTSTGDFFEDGTSYRTLTNPYDFITLYAASTNMWSIIGGTVLNSLRVNTISNSVLTTSSIVGNIVNAPFVNTSFLYPQTGLTFTTTSNLYPPVNAGVNTGATIGLITSNYLQIFSQSTVTSNLVGNSAFSTIFVGASLTPAYSTNRISTISLGNPTNRWFQTFAVSTITSTLNADNAFGTTLSYQNISTQNITGFNLLGTTILSTQAIFCSSLQIGPADAILDILGPLRTQDISTVTCQASTILANTITTNRIFGGPLVVNTTTTQNLYPLTIGAQIGFGSNTGQLGFYSEGHFRSTFTQVIQPTLDAGAFSNIVYVNGNISTPNIFSSTINSGTVTLTTGGFTQRVVSNAVAPSGVVSLNLTSGNVFFFTSAMATSNTANFTTANATVGSTYYVNFLTGLTPGTVTFTGNTGATTLSITGLSLVGNPSVPIGLHGAGQSFTPNASTRYMFTCIAIAP